MNTYSSGKWDFKKDSSINAKIEYLKERFQSTDDSVDAKCVRSLIDEYAHLKTKLKNVK